MDIKELEDYRLSDAVKFHTHLNPRIWGSDEHLLPEVRQKLLAIAADFKEFLGLDLEVKDITISGSNAAYTYTDHSDIDLHLVADLPKADIGELYRELFDAKKYQYNDQHNFTIGGYPVELYVQNASQEHKSQGIYSIANNDWVSVPKRRQPDIDDISVKSKYEDLGHRIESAIKSGDVKQLELLGSKVREFRQAGLDQTGEFGPENLAFKVLRSNGTLDRLRAARQAAKNQELSIDEAGKKKKKKSFRYGFGGYHYPGYHYYGQTDTADVGGDAGTENIKESVGDIQAQLEKFAAYCSDELGIENAPRIQLKRDPAWSQRNSTFGRYMPKINTLTLSVANRHPMDIMRTLAHELVHRRQDEIEPMPGHAGDTGSKWENQANAQAGVLMRDWGAKNPGMFDRKPLGEASGYIPVTDAEARDPRYSMAITQDIRPGEVQRQAAKMGWKTTAAGTPPTARTNGLVESLQRKLDQVKAETLTEEQLDEVNMSPGALQSWAKEHAAGMKSGFEAELIFKDLLKDADDEEDEDDGDTEPDYDQDEQADDIDDVLRFFSSEMTTRQRRDLSDEMYTNYREWYDEAVLEAFEDRARMLVKEYLEENDWDWQDKIAEYLQDTLGKTPEESDAIMNQGQENDDGSDNPDYVFAQREVEDQFDKLVEQTVSEGFDNDNYQAAYDEFASNFDGRSERDWLRTQGIRNMSDVSNEYSIDWPHWRPVARERDDFVDGNYHSSYAEMLANRLKETLGVKTQVESGTRGASEKSRTPDDVWVFEADGSLNADARVDMPVEIVSPPMPLEQTLEIMPKFFEWAASQGAYANRSTGLHMSVSMPEHAGDNLDYAKAALFLGDQYVLEQFGRTAQSYCQSALKEIKKRIDQRRKNLRPADNEVTKAFNQMREKLNSLATKAFAQPGGYGKYFSINPKEKYIEFRSAGGKDYIKDVPKLQNTMLRYARAMSIGMDPAAEKAEYAKKLYKLLGNVELQQNPADTTFGPTNKKTSGSVSAKSDKKDGIWYFTRYAAGELTESDLKKFVKQMQGEREAIKRVRSADKMWWKVYYASPGASDGPQIEVVARNPTEAVAVARKEWGITSATHRGFTDNDFVAEPLRMLTPAEIEQTRNQFEPQAPAPDDGRFAYDPESNPTGNFVIRRRDPDSNTATGPVIYRFQGGDANDAVEQARGWMMRRGIARTEIWLATSESTPEAILNAVPPAPDAPGGDRFAYDTNSNPDGNYVIRRRDGTGNDGVGPVIYRFIASGVTDALDQSQQWREARGLDRLDVWLSHVENVPPEILRAAPSTTVDNPPASRGSRSELIPPGLVPPGMPPNTPDGNWSIRNRNNSLDFGGADGIGPILYQFQAGSNSQAIDTSRQYARALEIPRERLWLSMTNEVPANYRTPPTQVQDTIIPPAGNADERRISDTGYWIVFNAATGSDLDNLALLPARTSQDAQLAYRQWYQTTGYMLGRDSIFYIRPGDDVDVSDATRRGLPMPPPMGSGPQTLEPSDPEGNWGIQAPNGQIVYRFVSHNATTLDARVSAWSNSTNSDVSDYRLVRVEPEEPNNSDDAGTTSPQWNIVDNDTGQLLHGFNGVPMNQAEANRIAAGWLDRHGPEDADMTQVSVVPVPQLYPGALDHITNSAIRDIPMDIAQNFQEPPASWDSGTPVTRGEWGGGDPAAQQGTDMSTANTSRSGRWLIVNSDTGEIVDEFTLPTSANRRYAEQEAAERARVDGIDHPYRVYAAD